MDDRLQAQLELDAMDDGTYVDQVYALMLRRSPDASGRARAVQGLADGTLSRATLLAELAGSGEFTRVRTLDDAVAFAAGARARAQRPRELRAPAGDERAIEICWALARLGSVGQRVLDAGTANAEPSYTAALLRAGFPGLVAFDMAPMEVPGLRSVQGDLRALPFPDQSFDAAVCISTLEHIGRDNAVYGGASELDESGMELALRELCRVLAREGRLIVTVPTGAREDHGWFVQLPPAEWLDLFGRAGLLVFEHEVYAQAGDGAWGAVPESAVLDRCYGEPGPAAAAVLCAELRRRTLGATLREQVRAVRDRLLG